MSLNSLIKSIGSNFTMSTSFLELIDYLRAIDSQVKADAFMKVWKEENLHKEDLGYILGYLSDADQTRLNNFFRTKHPVFDNEFLKHFCNAYLAGLFIGYLNKSFIYIDETLN